MSKQDEQLMLEYRNGEPQALEMLFERYKKPIFNFAYRVLGNRADAEDVTSDLFLTLTVKADTYKPTAKFSTWIFTIARNNCISKIRQRKKITFMWFTKNDSAEYEPWDIPDPNTLPPEELQRREIAREVRKTIAQLPNLQKEALVLREYHQLSYAQISEVLQCSLENVKILIYRARERVKEELPSFITEERDD